MRTLALTPERNAGIANRPRARGTELSAPTTAYGAIEPNQPYSMDASWNNLSPDEFNYMMAFWRTATARGTLSFLVDVPVSSLEVERCRAQFSGGLSIDNVSGGTASVSARLSLFPVQLRYALAPSTSDLIAQVAADL